MKDLRNDYLKKDEEKLMEAIHTNYRNSRMEYRINRELEEIAKKENTRKEKRAHRIMMIALVIAILVVGVLGVKYNEKQIKECIAGGNDETFCRYAGE